MIGPSPIDVAFASVCVCKKIVVKYKKKKKFLNMYKNKPIQLHEQQQLTLVKLAYIFLHQTKTFFQKKNNKKYKPYLTTAHIDRATSMTLSFAGFEHARQ